MIRIPRLPLAIASLAALLPAALFANPSAFDKTPAGPGPADDVAPSMGVFRIVVEPAYRPWFDANIPSPFWDGVSRLTSPVLYDESPQTTIGRSAAHLEDSPADLLGTPVGTAGTIVKDADMTFPPGFDTPNPNRYEVHTELRSMFLTPTHECQSSATVCTSQFPISVKAGTGQGLQLCPGEIESNSDDGFPAKSFFDVFVEVDLGGAFGFGVVKNQATDPLIVAHDPIDGFPPQVVYLHENTEAVPVYFRDSGTTGSSPFISYNAGDRFGYLVLAGHGEAQGSCFAFNNCASFWNGVTSTAEMPLPHATATLLSLFESAPVNDGLEVRWQFSDPSQVLSVDLERAQSAFGPWNAVTAERHDEAGVTVALDRGVKPGELYFYRIAVTNLSGQRNIVGTLAITAGSADAAFALGRILPNPSKGTTRVEFTVGRESSVRVSILDVQGRTVAVLANGPHRPGRYQATWNGHDQRGEAPTGVYFVRYVTPAKILVKRLTITR